MSTLTHVCMWSDTKKEWVRITAEKASELYPRGTISAKCGLFMCELCGQYVILTDGDVNVRYFKHNLSEEVKDCPERMSVVPNLKYNAKDINLPIRIKNIEQNFEFELGFTKIPVYLLDDNFLVTIYNDDFTDDNYTYKKERFYIDKTTFLSIGDNFSKTYTLNFTHSFDNLHKFWPCKIKGIEQNGTLFDMDTKIKLPYDADVIVNKDYLLLTNKKINYSKSLLDLHIKKINEKNNWYLYVVNAKIENEYTAKFFLYYHCRLTQAPALLNAIWPVYINDDEYSIKHNNNDMYMCLIGENNDLQTVPNIELKELSKSNDKAKLYKLSNLKDKLQISAGRSHILKYVYFLKEKLENKIVDPKVEVKDLKNEDVISGISYNVPYKNTLNFKAISFNITIYKFQNNELIEKIQLKYNESFEMNDIYANTSIKVLIGCDVIWHIKFIKNKFNLLSDNELFKYITQVSGADIKPPHSLKTILKNLQEYPKVCLFIKDCLKCNSIKEQSYRRLQKRYINLINK